MLPAALNALPDVALLDIEMPGGDGLSAAAALKPSPPGISMSRSATSGKAFKAVGTTSSPRDASATISMSSSRESRAARAPRTIA